MKTLALLAILALQTTSLWDHAPESVRTRLTAAGTEQAVGAPPLSPRLAAVGPLPIRSGDETYEPGAASILALDTATGTTLYSHNASARLPIASITKVVTSLVILSRHSTTDILKVPKLPEYTIADERIGLIAGESYTVGDLVRATLINSGNDAADALAIADSGSIPKFAAAMNLKMAEWGIPDVHFVGPSGLQDTNNYASATALGKIARLGLVNPFFREVIAQSSASISSTTGRIVPLVTTNQLLATGEFYGIKTGYTPAAGECFVGLTRVNGHQVITVVLKANGRFVETQRLTNWIGRNWQWL